MKQINYISRGGELEYIAPIVDMLNVSVENGFAASDIELGGDSGFTGDGGQSQQPDFE